MTLKEKLELLWKYLLLAVIFFGILQLGNTHKSRMTHHDFPGKHGEKMIWFGDEEGEMDIDVEIEKMMDGDSSMTIIINGESLNLDDLEQLDDHVYIKKMRHSGDSKAKKVKVITKKITTN